MANLQATKVTSSLDVQQNTYIKLGNNVMSSGTFAGSTLAHYGNGPYYTTSWATNGIYIQCNNSDFNFAKFTSPNNYVGLSLASVDSNSNTTNLLGLGASAGTGTTDGKFLINAGNTGKPVLEFTNCLGNSAAAGSSAYTVFKGWLGVRIGANVGASAATTGLAYIRLWGA